MRLSLWRGGPLRRLSDRSGCRRWWAGSRSAAPYYVCAACGQGQCPLDAALGLHATVSVPGCAAWPAASGRCCPSPRRRGPWPRRRGCSCRPAPCAPSRRRSGRGASRRWRRRSPRPGGGAAAGGRGRRRSGSTWPWMACASWAPTAAGREVKVGVVVPVRRRRRRRAAGAGQLRGRLGAGRRLRAAAGAGGAPARRWKGPRWSPCSGDGAEWIWNLAAEHFPHAVQIVDWFHASERVWELGRALYGEGTAETTAWVEAQLGRLAQGQAATLADRVAGAALSRRGGGRP